MNVSLKIRFFNRCIRSNLTDRFPRMVIRKSHSFLWLYPGYHYIWQACYKLEDIWQGRNHRNNLENKDVGISWSHLKNAWKMPFITQYFSKTWLVLRKMIEYFLLGGFDCFASKWLLNQREERELSTANGGEKRFNSNASINLSLLVSGVSPAPLPQRIFFFKFSIPQGRPQVIY